jgi:hypothetical protein
VARLDDPNDDARELRRLALAVVAALYDAVEQLPAGAELHDDVDVLVVLVGALDGDDVPVSGEVVHDLDLAAHVLNILPRDELALGDGLAGVVDPRGEVRAEVGGAELPLPELAPERVVLPEGRGRVAEHVGRELRGRGHPAPHAGGRRGRGSRVRRITRAWRGPLPVPRRRVVGGGRCGDGRVARRVVALRATETGQVLGSKRDAARVAHHNWGPARRRGGPSRMYPGLARGLREGRKKKKKKPRRVVADTTETRAGDGAGTESGNG